MTKVIFINNAGDKVIHTLSTLTFHATFLKCEHELSKLKARDNSWEYTIK